MATVCPSCGHRNLEGADECSECGADLRTIDVAPQGQMVELEASVMQLPLSAMGLGTIHIVSPDTPVEAALYAINRQKLDILAVAENGQLIGLLSVRDVIMRLGSDYASKLSLPVRQFMTAMPVTLPPDAPINFAINCMDVGGYRHVPVVENGKLCGVVSSRDVLHHLIKHTRGHALGGSVVTPRADDRPAAGA